MNRSFLIFVLNTLIVSQVFAQKITGVNFVAEKTAIEKDGFDHLKKINAEWVAWVPYAYCKVTTGEIFSNNQRQWKGETLEGSEQAILVAKQNGLKVMLKPHVWLSDLSYGGRLQMPEENWCNWQDGYKKYILEFAKLAQKHEIEIFCIGTEQQASVERDTAFWNQLILDVKQVFKGKITYAANWDEYKTCPLWENLDYIGIDAYFPLLDKAIPAVDELEKGWNKWKGELYSVYRIFQKPILFTEFGYRSTQYATRSPWEDVTDDSYCESCQAEALQAKFNALWAETWTAGGFLWKWFEPNKSEKYEHVKSFFAKGKIAEQTITENYNRFNNQ